MILSAFAGALIINMHLPDFPACETHIVKGKAHFAAEVFVFGINDCHKCGACTAEICRICAVCVGNVENVRSVGDKLHSVWLVEAVIHGCTEILVLARKERSREKSRS